MQDLDIYNTFISTPREKLKKMQNVLRTYYNIDISNSI
jgi:hypothetical protein